MESVMFRMLACGIFKAYYKKCYTSKKSTLNNNTK